jgi:hypothetical protein
VVVLNDGQPAFSSFILLKFVLHHRNLANDVLALVLSGERSGGVKKVVLQR